MTAATECGSCAKPNLDGAALCDACTDTYLYDLGAVDDVLDTLRPTVEMQDVNGDSVGSSGTKHAPAPLNLDAMAAQANLQLHVRLTGRRLLRVWVQAWEAKVAKLTAHVIGPTLPLPAKPSLPGNEQLAAWIIVQHNLIRMAVWAPGAKRELANLLKTAQTAAERRQPRVFAGTCSFETSHPDTPDEPIVCGAELYALPGDTIATCKDCNSTYEVATWRAHSKTAAEYAILTPTELSRALGGYGFNIRPGTIRMWATRGHIHRANPDHDETGHPIPAMYRLGDALDTYQAMQIRKHQPKENTP
ncbi:hypothetical protein [Arthrobacter sp. efr-133-TYG-118]|uniref:hypothetical protein n=1 Tax=Arthrobacter sp. efr-133-TYG-118 TaxID=3040279 RepID=UPI00254EE38B|nr:hypothetical protein [Arthrobacter sp. efr-133-TYG-118]